MPNRAMSGQMPEVLSLQQMPWVTVRCVKLRTDERRVPCPCPWTAGAAIVLM